MTPTVLFVPGFVADTYSEIERSFVELSANARGVQFLWLVPDMRAPQAFARSSSAATLTEPVYVPHLRTHGIPYVVGNIHRYNLIANLRLFHRLFRRYPVDAVYTHFGYERFWAALLGKLYGKIVVWNEHWNSLGTRFVFAKKLFYLLCVDEFISISDYIARTLPKQRPVHTLLNAISPYAGTVTAATREQMRLKLDIPKDRRVVLMVAAFRSEKRHGLALEICRRLLRARRDLYFVFLGEGPERQGFLDAARTDGCERDLCAPGHVDNVDDYYQAADVCMLTSLNEPFGYCVLEAMKYGLPMISFDNGGPAEVIESGANGILIEEGDLDAFAAALTELLDDGERRRRIGENAMAAVREQYSRGAWERRLCAILREVILRRSPPAAPAASGS